MAQMRRERHLQGHPETLEFVQSKEGGKEEKWSADGRLRD